MMVHQTICHYCGKVLPEAGNTHVIYCITRLQDEVAVCINCMMAKKYKPCRLERAVDR